MGRRRRARPLRDRALRGVRRQGQAGARHLPRLPAHQRRFRRHALPGHRHAGAGCDRPSRHHEIREEVPHAEVRPGHGAREALSEPARGDDQHDPPPGGEEARPRDGRRGGFDAGQHRRGDTLARSELRGRRAMASGIHVRPGHRRRAPRRHADPERISRRRARSARRSASSLVDAIARPPRRNACRKLASTHRQSRHRLGRSSRGRRRSARGRAALRGGARRAAALGRDADPQAHRDDREVPRAGRRRAPRRSRTR